MEEGNHDYIEKWINGTLTDEEKIVFENTEDYKELLRLTESLQAFRAPEYAIGDALKKVNEANGRKTAKQVFFMPYRSFLKVAAAILLVMVSVYFFYRLPGREAETLLSASNTLFYLPDSSSLVLNTGSQLSYSEKNWEDARQVDMEGEAYFKVAKGKKFDVITRGGMVTVLGTEFNVKNRKDFFEVACYEGAVRVIMGKTTVELKPSEVVRVVEGTRSKLQVYSAPSPEWLRGESSFQSIPYRLVIDEFERQYDVHVELNQVDASRLFSGRFTHHDIQLALQSISLPLHITYELKEDTRVVLLNGID